MKHSDLAVEWTEVMETREMDEVVQEGKMTIRKFRQGEPLHTYITVITEDFSTDHVSDFLAAEKVLTNEIAGLFPPNVKKVCITGLGNEWMTADALGPRVIQKLQQNYLFLEHKKAILLQPGVRLQSGIETANYVHAITKEMKPDVIVLIDSLKAAQQPHLARTIQVTDAGIRPGSGLYSDRAELSQAYLGIPVIAIGIPTVVSSIDVTAYQLEKALHYFAKRIEMKQDGNPLANSAFTDAQTSDIKILENIFGEWALLSKEERHQFLIENSGPTDAIVTLTAIHEWIERWSETIASALVEVLTPGLVPYTD